MGTDATRQDVRGVDLVTKEEGSRRTPVTMMHPRPYASLHPFFLFLSLQSAACGGAALDVGSDDAAPGAAQPGVAPASGPDVVALGTGHGCALLADATVACWGFNRSGQVGVSPEQSQKDDSGGAFVLVPTRVAGLHDVVQIAAGHQTSCAVTRGGEVLCWGAVDRTSAPAASDPPSHVPAKVAGLDGVVEVKTAGGPTCARKSDGTVSCWGRNTYLSVAPSKLDDRSASMNEVLPPTQIQGITDAVELAVGDSMTCVRHASGEVTCWGRVQLVHDTYTPDSAVPRRIPGVQRARQLAIAQSSAIALIEDGTVMAWGDSGDEGMLLHLTGPRDPIVTSYQDGVPPARFPDLEGIVSIAADYRTMCALARDTTVRCWGRNDVGELGQGRTTKPILAPTLIAGVTARRISVGTWNSCVVRPGGDVVCWGGGSSGALGTGRDEKYAAKPDAPVLLPAPLAPLAR